VLGYASLGGLLALIQGWSRDVALDQAVGLAAHAGVVLARGVLPLVLAPVAACVLWRRARGADPGVGGTLALALPLAAVIARLVLTTPVGGRAHLVPGGAVDWFATVVLLAAVAAGADLFARRLLRPRSA
jgi:hypothetical protein